MSLYDSLFVKKLSGKKPSGRINISEDGSYDVTDYELAIVDTDPDSTGRFILSGWENGYPSVLTVSNMSVIPDHYLQSFTTIPAMSNIRTLVLSGPINGYGSSCFRGMKNIESVVIPDGHNISDNSVSVGYFVFTESDFKHVTFDCRPQMTFSFSSCPNMESLTFNKGIWLERWRNTFYASASGKKMKLYDFRGSQSVVEMPTLEYLPHADGCVIRVPSSLLNAWKSATNWCDLPTDPTESGYVVWQGV